MVEQRTIDIGNCLIIGGNGQLGRAIVKQLIAKGKTVRVIDLKSYSDDTSVEVITGDLCDAKVMDAACKNIDTVFHTASVVYDPKLPKALYYKVNVDGNRNVIGKCLKNNVKRLIYTSSRDVIRSGNEPHYFLTEDQAPYPKRLPRDTYSRTKIIAEQEIINANCDEFVTCALRPTGIWGPYDNYQIPNVLKRVRNGHNVRFGKKGAKFSRTFVENAAYAHLLAAEHLFPGSKIAGEKYFIADPNPDSFWDFFDPILARYGLSTTKKVVPFWLIYIIASFNEFFNPKSLLNRFTAMQIGINHTYSFEKASRDFGYSPLIGKEEAMKKTVEWLDTWFKLDE
ncbi:MAG: NAD-dependent epimerase/dehydratase family protein [Candidatus Heimdallarchaeota archaeon]|nr:NAD-dependent epimerase/dehydratase family protein [Candidatus Heimdallarchaeota archaeon]